MRFFSGVLRYFKKNINNLASLLRVLFLKLLYPNLQIDFKTKIGPNCTIKCIEGGKMIISNCIIKEGCHIIVDFEGYISIDTAFIGMNSVIIAKESIIINQGCLLAEMVVIRDQDHVINLINDNDDRHLFNHSPIYIGKKVWIASKATVLRGVRIDDFSVVAASSVVNCNIPACQVWGGIPSKFINYVNKMNL